MEYKSSVKLVDPYHTSKDCSRCGYTNKDLKGERFGCVNDQCSLVIDRQFNSGINVYLDMEGLSQDTKWFDQNILRGFTQIGAECTDSTVKAERSATARKENNELARSLYDLMKPQFYTVKSKHK